MKTLKLTSSTPISIARFDTGETVTFNTGVEVTVDDATADYLLAAKIYDENKLLIVFEQVA